MYFLHHNHSSCYSVLILFSFVLNCVLWSVLSNVFVFGLTKGFRKIITLYFNTTFLYSIICRQGSVIADLTMSHGDIDWAQIKAQNADLKLQLQKAGLDVAENFLSESGKSPSNIDS